MARLKLTERIRLTHLAADRLRREAVSSLLGSPALRWQFGAFAAEQLVIMPQDLRTTDPSFWDEIEIGEFGLAGSFAAIDDASPFDIEPPSIAWYRELQGFAWLRHLAAAARPEAAEFAKLVAAEWAVRHRSGTGLGWRPEIIARRLMSWISHADLLLEGSDPETYDIITESLGIQIVRLSSNWRNAPVGYPRLVALTGLVMSLLSISGHDDQVSEAEKSLMQELSRQILPDGGHVGRNPGVLIELLLDFLPLSQCFTARNRPIPEELLEATPRMLEMLRFMRLGDGMLARFNGMSIARPASLATVLAYDDSPTPEPGEAGNSRYLRLARGSTILIQDVGTPPPLEMAGDAHAGCLSFEVSSGKQLLLVNGGAPSPGNAEEWRGASRATASHNTLCLGDKSSSKLIRHGTLEEIVGAPPIRHPDHVKAIIKELGSTLECHSHHDGYKRRFGLLHHRTLSLNDTGTSFTGTDLLRSDDTAMRLREDVPFAIHFHLHPTARCRNGTQENSALIELADGEEWRFSVEGAAMSLEESTFYADSAGPRRSLQIVARGATFGETEVRWAFEQTAIGSEADDRRSARLR